VSQIGSGVIINTKGYILTNYHVIAVDSGDTPIGIRVHLEDGVEYKAKLVGIDPQNDIAVIKIFGSHFTPAQIPQEPANQIGEWVAAIGNPFGYLMADSKPSVSVGVVSATNRRFTLASGIKFHHMIQTDASIHPGNSGGSLINIKGEVIGINTFIFQGGATGLGFAIPIQTAMKIALELITYGAVREWTTGIFTNPYNNKIKSGILVTGIESGSPGKRAGLKKGDIIYRLAGKTCNNMQDFAEGLREFQVGDSVKIQYSRGKSKWETFLILAEKVRSFK